MTGANLSRGAAGAGLPSVATALTAEEIRGRLALASRRGRLPGYSDDQLNGDLFRVSAFGQPFDGIVVGEAAPDNSATRLRFRWRLATRAPAVFAVSLVLTVWPGSYFMDQLMIQFFPSVRESLATWVWYVPFAAVSGVWAWVAVMRRTRRAVSESARQLVDRIATEVDGTVDAA